MSSEVASRLRAVPWTARQALAVFILPWIVLPALLLISVAILSPYLPLAHQFLAQLKDNSPQANFAIVIIDLIGSYTIIWHYLRRHQVGWGSIGLRPFKLGRAIVYIIGFFVVFALTIGLIYSLVHFLYPGFNADQPQTNEFTGLPATYHTISLLALVIIPPLVEEPVFRGFLFPAFSKRYGLIVGAVASSALFGLAHLQGNVSVYTFIIGLILCFLYVRLGSIVPGIGLHMLNNYIAYIAINQPK